MANPQTEAPKKKRLVPVLVNRASSIHIPTKREEDGSLNPAGIIFLASGYNLVDEEKWTAAKQNPTVRLLLEEKIPPASAPEESPEKVGFPIIEERRAVDADNPLVTLSENEALRFVAETFVVPLLRQLEQQESRPLVLRAIRGQIDKIEKPKAEHKAASAAAAQRQV